MATAPATARLPGPRSGGIAQGQSQHQQPRRKLESSASISHLGNKRQKLSHSPEDATLQVSPAAQLTSQGSGSDQSASRWFDNANKHVPQSAQDNAEYDDEPPFFIGNHQPNYLPNTFAPSEGSRLFGVQSRLDSENEELRSVIDDLTVENKRLKTILRHNQKSNRNSPSTDGPDKLFEVRMHGLNSEKRRELEFLLKNFATSVHTTAPSVSNSTTGSGVSANYGKAKTDSGYASNSNSGNLMHSNAGRGLPGVSQGAREKAVKSYLHDTPDTLLPRPQPIMMSEHSRMALVVRRLEQLFTGRKAAPGEHAQPLQQQELSQMAARADAKNNKKRRTEGTREAHILPPDTKVNLDAIESGPEKRKRPELKSSDSDMSGLDSTGLSISRPGSPDQRPTRPLDLDIHRAQIAADNIKYLRHLGLSSPHLDANEHSDAWLYLNLLINMAQLHTINVTPAFIRKSIKKFSTKFELSKDGHKVRWIGGSEGTIFSKEEETAIEAADKETNSPQESNEDTGTGGSSSKRSKTDSNSNAVVSNSTPSEDKTSGLQTSSASRQQVSTGATSNQLSSLQTKPSAVSSAFDYKPLVYRERQAGLAVEESYLQDSDSSLGDSSRDSSGLVHALSRSNLNQQRNSDEGLITFYNNPFYCSDYSGDKMPNNMLPPRHTEPGAYLGSKLDDWQEPPLRAAEACYFTPQFMSMRFREIEDDKIPHIETGPLLAAGEAETQPIEFVVSGLGGVVPDDNFAVDVDVNMTRVSRKESAETIKTVPHTGTAVRAAYRYTRGGSHKIQLLPSRLPPPSYIFFTSSSSSGNQIEDDDDVDSSEDSDETSSSADEDHPAPPSFLQRWTTKNSGRTNTVDEEIEDDSSMDMLAVARAADPVQIAEQERQYLINQPGGRVVAGSLAATVGASRTTPSVSDIGSNEPQAVSEREYNSEEGEQDDTNDDDMDVDDQE